MKEAVWACESLTLLFLFTGGKAERDNGMMWSVYEEGNSLLFQEVIFCAAKDDLSACKRPPFTSPKMTF